MSGLLIPSLLAADFTKLGQQLQEVQEAGLTTLHLDVMDGAFVPAISFGMPVIASLRKETNLFFDVHLMVEEPGRYIREFREAGADSITVHYEACADVSHTLATIKETGAKVSLAVNPDTPVSVLTPFLTQVDMILVMSVHPGFGGQRIIPETLEKIKQLVKIREQKHLQFIIEIDGGVNADTIETVVSHGADWMVAGTAIFKGNIMDNVATLKEVITHAS